MKKRLIVIDIYSVIDFVAILIVGYIAVKYGLLNACVMSFKEVLY